MAPIWCKYEYHYHDLTNFTRPDVTFLKLDILVPTCLMLTRDRYGLVVAV